MYSEQGLRGVDPVGVRAGVPVVDRWCRTACPGRRRARPPRRSARIRSRARMVSTGAPLVHGAGRPLAVVDHRAHEVVGDADRVVGVLEEDRVVGAAADVEAAVVAGVDQRPGLLLLLGLAVDELDDVRVVDVRGSPSWRRGASCRRDLMTPAKASKPRMKETGPEAVPPPASVSLRRADRREVRAGARAVLEEHALGAWPASRIDSIVSSTELMKQAEHCGCSSTPTLNQTGELKLIFCR